MWNAVCHGYCNVLCYNSIYTIHWMFPLNICILYYRFFGFVRVCSLVVRYLLIDLRSSSISFIVYSVKERPQHTSSSTNVKPLSVFVVTSPSICHFQGKSSLRPLAARMGWSEFLSVCQKTCKSLPPPTTQQHNNIINERIYLFGLLAQ